MSASHYRDQDAHQRLDKKWSQFFLDASSDMLKKARCHQDENDYFSAYLCLWVAFENLYNLYSFRAKLGSFCFDTVSYVTESSSKMNLALLVAFLNSKVLDWYFRLGSTNSKVNEYQFNNLPVPSFTETGAEIHWQSQFERGDWKGLSDMLCTWCDSPGVMSSAVAEAIAAMSRRIFEIEGKRVLKNRRERSRLAPECQPIQDAIDAVLFRCYGLSDDDALGASRTYTF